MWRSEGTSSSYYYPDAKELLYLWLMESSGMAGSTRPCVTSLYRMQSNTNRSIVMSSGTSGYSLNTLPSLHSVNSFLSSFPSTLNEY